VKLRIEQTITAATRPIRSRTQPGRPRPARTVTTVQLVSAPTISTSPWAKLIRLMMPYTIV
jgi:hypothetical protein